MYLCTEISEKASSFLVLVRNGAACICYETFYGFFQIPGCWHLCSHEFRLQIEVVCLSLWDAIQFWKLEHNFVSSTKSRCAAWHRLHWL
ncbi:hypothetical protein PVAP13_2NG616500 [Panicum virgatum]|uniref:Uncharacterized protein n=1 Tax=Panicum virgatum TaxID=38727 RepID=A0A8T0W3K5_PANVG|nr:hypothetical protein PVAP13_2NG616500 [Panicum virgatum]